MWNQDPGDGERKSKKRTAKKMISFMKGMTKLMEQMEEIQQDGEEANSGDESTEMWPLYTGINRSFSKMMQLAGNVISKKITKNLALGHGQSSVMDHDYKDDSDQGCVESEGSDRGSLSSHHNSSKRPSRQISHRGHSVRINQSPEVVQKAVGNDQERVYEGRLRRQSSERSIDEANLRPSFSYTRSPSPVLDLREPKPPGENRLPSPFRVPNPVSSPVPNQVPDPVSIRSGSKSHKTRTRCRGSASTAIGNHGADERVSPAPDYQAQLVADKEDFPMFDQGKNSSFERNKDAAFNQMKRSVVFRSEESPSPPRPQTPSRPQTPPKPQISPRPQSPPRPQASPRSATPVKDVIKGSGQQLYNHKNGPITAILPSGEVWVQPPRPVRSSKSVRPKSRQDAIGGGHSIGKGHFGEAGRRMGGERFHDRSRNRRGKHGNQSDRRNTPFEKKLLEPSDPRFKTRVCRHWADGSACPYGDDCNFAHELLDTSKSRGRGRRGEWNGSTRSRSRSRMR